MGNNHFSRTNSSTTSSTKVHLHTRCAFPQLQAVIEYFGDQIKENSPLPIGKCRRQPKRSKQKLQASGTTSFKHLLTFEEIVKQKLTKNEVGGKALRLAEVASALTLNTHFKVPTGGCLPTSVYEHYFSRIPNSDELAKKVYTTKDSKEQKEILSSLQDCILKLEFDKDLIEEIELFLKMLPQNSTLAIRSSATLEDGTDFSLAGLCSSFLHVPMEVKEVVSSIKKCWASLWEERVVKYLNNLGKSEIVPKMGVVIQQMIDSFASGVVFTLHPTTGNEQEMLIETVWGLGEGLVSGEISPTSLAVSWLTKEYKIIEQPVQQKKYIRGQSGQENTTILVPTTEMEQKNVPISKEQIHSLVEMGLHVATHYGHPQDIEWAIDQSGQLYMTQTRPITSFTFTLEKSGCWFSGFVDKSWLAMTLTSVSGYSLYQQYLGKLDQDPKFKDENQICRIFYGSTYVNYEAYMKADEAKNAPENWKVMKRFWKQTKAFVDHCKENQTLLWKLLPLISKIPDDHFYPLIELIFDECIELDFHSFSVGSITDIMNRNVMESLNTIRRELEDLKDKIPKIEELIGNVHPGTGSPLRDLRAIAKRIVQDNFAKDFVLRLKPHKLLRKIQKEPKLEWLLEELNSFLKTHFWLCEHDEDIQQVRWLDDPTFVFTTLIEQVTTLSESKNSPPNNENPDNLPKKETFNQIKAEFLHFLQQNSKTLSKEFIDDLEKQIKYLRTYLYWKEEVHFTYGRSHFFVYKLSNELGERWKRKGLLEHAEDIYYMDHRDIRRLIKDPNSKPTAKELVFYHKTLRNMTKNFQHPHKLQAEEIRLPQKIPNTNTQILTGIPCSSGKVTAPARVILSLDQAHQVQKGEVLVTHYTSPGWTPLFSAISALITEIGGLLSHGAIVARECKIPAVLQVSHATEFIHTGDLIEVDGSSGIITFLKRSGEN